MDAKNYVNDCSDITGANNQRNSEEIRSEFLDKNVESEGIIHE